jgi:hypothetical protein
MVRPKGKSYNKRDDVARQDRRNYVLAASNKAQPNTYEPFEPKEDTFLAGEQADIWNEMAREYIQTGNPFLLNEFPKPKRTVVAASALKTS